MTSVTPTRRVILLGASNLVRCFSTVVETSRLIWGEQLEVMAAIGHGRSFGQDSSVCGRKISGIFPCDLWHDLERRSPLPTVALVTDIGNDLAYEVPVKRLLKWVELCIDRLTEAGATTIITQLPLDSINGLGERRFRFFRALMFPQCSLSLAELKSRSHELNTELLALGERRNISVIPARAAWYGLDPIHIKRSVSRVAWPTILSAWRDNDQEVVAPRASLWRWAYLSCLAPSKWSLLGWSRCCQQPSGVLDDGTTISLY